LSFTLDHGGFFRAGNRPGPLYLVSMTRAGIVTVVGRPNVGKSTLLNHLVGERLSIVSPKPQSTRDRVVGIRTSGDIQMIILDTPGLLEPRYALQRAMRRAAEEALREADVILDVLDATEHEPKPFVTAITLDPPVRAPVFTARNKADLLSATARAELAGQHPADQLISAQTGEGIDALVERLGKYLPESPFLYPADELSTQTVRFFAAEFIRETAFELLSEEVPYSVACEIEEFREDRSPTYIRAMLYIERESQKSILIGAGGATIKAIGTAARKKIETFIGAPAYLDLRVKVLANWRRDPRSLSRFGYRMPAEERHP
jgi:GTP-binding protein Era